MVQVNRSLLLITPMDTHLVPRQSLMTRKKETRIFARLAARWQQVKPQGELEFTVPNKLL